MTAIIFLFGFLAIVFAAPFLLIYIIAKASTPNRPGTKQGHYLLMTLFSLCAIALTSMVIYSASQILDGELTWQTKGMKEAVTYTITEQPIPFLIYSAFHIGFCLLWGKFTYGLFVEWRKRR